MRTAGDWARLVAKGFAMGTADIVPGVSGGTIAFITGIYSELISTIAGLGPSTVADLFKLGIVETWKKYNLSFLTALVGGILTAVVLISNVVHSLQDTHPEELNGFFMGLVIASIPLIARSINKKKLTNLLMLAIGGAVAFYITSREPIAGMNSYWYLALTGAIAICAMILPGISGSFLLIILGTYSRITGAFDLRDETTEILSLDNLELTDIVVFASGVVLGLLLFTRGVKKILDLYYEQTLSVLVGFMIGALGVLWPWKKNLRVLFEHSDGRKEYLTENIAPYGETVEIAVVCGVALLGAVIVTGLDKLSRR